MESNYYETIKVVHNIATSFRAAAALFIKQNIRDWSVKCNCTRSFLLSRPRYLRRGDVS